MSPNADLPSAGLPSADLPGAGLSSAGLSSGLSSADLSSADLPSAGLPGVLALAADLVVPAADPFPTYAELRRRPGLLYSDRQQAYVLARHAEVVAAFTTPAVFTSTRGVGHDGVGDPPTLLDLDPPRHTAERRRLAAAFSRRAAGGMVGMVRERVRWVLDRVDVGAGCDLQQELFDRVPVAAVSGLLGVPMSACDELRAALHEILADGPGADAAAGQAVELVAGRSTAAAGGLLAELAGGGDAAFASRLLTLLLGGQEPLATLCGAALIRLAGAGAGATGPDLAAAVGQAARLDSPTQYMFREVTRPVGVADQRLGRGDRVMLLIAAANRDEAGRGGAAGPGSPGGPAGPGGLGGTGGAGGSGIAFGAGPHACLGQWLARVAAQVALAELLSRVPLRRLAGARPAWAFSGNVRCLTSLVRP